MVDVTPALASIFQRIAIRIRTIQAWNFVISLQQEEVAKLIAETTGAIGVEHVHDELNEVEISANIILNKWIVKTKSIILHIYNQVSWARDMFLQFSENKKHSVVNAIAKFLLKFIDDIFLVHAERDGSNNQVRLKHHLWWLLSLQSFDLHLLSTKWSILSRAHEETLKRPGHWARRDLT